jgi:uncharacterized protein with ParB-like and HNH nuclease domain
MQNNISELSIRELFENGKYVIPIYQRNYAWGDKEISQLIQDIVDYCIHNSNSKYYIGSLVIYERDRINEVVFETIDGQQRFTTLSILLSVIKNEINEIELSDKDWFKINLEFDSRKKSTNTLKEIFDMGPFANHNEFNEEIRNGYNEAKKNLRRIIEENERSIDFSTFYKYLINNVIIMRVAVPKDTDLNHYFEIMNNRGEQLEKHEILKASCLNLIKNDKYLSYTFNLIWEACSNMERYVQYGFEPKLRDVIFKKNDWNTLVFDSLTEIAAAIEEEDKISNIQSSELVAISFKDLLNENKNTIQKNTLNEEFSDRFSTTINFSNFLLHVLRVQTQKDIPLDDKRLISIFEPYYKGENGGEFVKEFGYNLLKCKFLCDKYIIKREFKNNSEAWSLKQVKQYDGNKINYINTFGHENNSETENKTIIMLLSMFHVSTPTLVYKHWLNAALNFVYTNANFTSSEYIDYLKNLAKAYLYDRYLAKKQIEFYDIIYKNKGRYQNEEINEELLHKGTSVENFIFNYVDFLLWEQKNEYRQFEFSFRSSVEHFYPQHPIEGNPPLEGNVDHFGNLCLISSSKNSKLSNNMPVAKYFHFKNSVSIESIKQMEMMKYLENGSKKWEMEEINHHYQQIKSILLG